MRLPTIQAGDPVVLSGESYLDRAIRWVHVAEVANIADLLRGGELLLTTGQALTSSPANQRGFMEALVERGIAGLVVELGEHLEEVPSSAVETAQKADLPLVVLRRQVRFVDITEQLHRHLIDRQLVLLGQATRFDGALTALVVAGEGVAAVVEALAEAIGTAVHLINEHNEVLHLAPLESGNEPIDDGDRTSIEIPGQATQAGWLVVKGPSDDLSAWQHLAAERAASVVALLIARADQERMLSLRASGSFLHELAAGAVDPDDAERRARRFGFSAGGRRLLPLAIAVKGGGDALLEERIDVPSAIAWELQHSVAANAGSILVGTRAQTRYLLGLATMPRGQNRARTAEWFAAEARRATLARYGSQAETTVVIGDESRSVALAAGPLRATRDAVGPAVDSTPKAWHDAATPDLERLLISLRADERLVNFSEGHLRGVVDHDAASKSPLLPTLAALTEHGGHRSGTARALGVRRQSLYRRIERLEQILGRSLDDPAVLFELHLALRARANQRHALTDRQAT